MKRSTARSTTTASIAAVGDTIVANVISQNRADGARGIAQGSGVNGDLKRIKFGDGFITALERESELTKVVRLLSVFLPSQYATARKTS